MRKLSKSIRVFTVALMACVIALGFALTACGSSNTVRVTSSEDSTSP